MYTIYYMKLTKLETSHSFHCSLLDALIDLLASTETCVLYLFVVCVKVFWCLHICAISPCASNACVWVRQNVLPKRSYLPTKLHGVTSQKLKVFFYTSLPVSISGSTRVTDFNPRGPKCTVHLYLQSMNIQANYLYKIMKENNFDKGPGDAHYTYIGTDLNFPVYFKRKYSIRWFVDTKDFLLVYFYSKTNQKHQCLKFILFWNKSTCFGRPFRPSSAVQDCTYSNRRLSNRYCCLLASKQILSLTTHIWKTKWNHTSTPISLHGTYRGNVTFHVKQLRMAPKNGK